MRRIRLLVLASKPKGMSPSQRFRLEQWAPRLSREHAIDVEFEPFESPALAKILNERGRTLKKAWLVASSFGRRATVLPMLKSYDAVVIHREAALIGPAIYERIIARSTPMIFDFDDSIWSNAQAMNNGVFSKLHCFGKTNTLCRIASACTPGNEFLAEYARERNQETFVVPTSIELDDYPHLAERPSERPFTVCWTGSTSTLAHFELARPALEAVAAQIPLEIKIICNKPPEQPVAGARTVFVPWSSQSEAQEIGDSHVGLMPLPNDEAALGKCGLKALQCMATGRPVVVSPVGVNTTIVQHGKNGFLASTSEEFAQALLCLASSPALRSKLGKHARKTVADHYSASVVAGTFAQVVRSVVRSSEPIRSSTQGNRRLASPSASA